MKWGSGRRFELNQVKVVVIMYEIQNFMLKIYKTNGWKQNSLAEMLIIMSQNANPRFRAS
jgi:hypothetical protein